MEILTNFEQINWHWTKIKQNKLEKSLKLINDYLMKNVENGNSAELLLLTAINNFIKMLNICEISFLDTKKQLQTFFDILITDTIIAPLITENTRNKLIMNIQEINNEYNANQLKIEIYKFILFLVSIFERIINKRILENSIEYSSRKNKETKKQKIINLYMKNPNIKQKQAAERIGSSLSYVKKVMKEYRKSQGIQKK